MYLSPAKKRHLIRALQSQPEASYADLGANFGYSAWTVYLVAEHYELERGAVPEDPREDREGIARRTREVREVGFLSAETGRRYPPWNEATYRARGGGGGAEEIPVYPAPEGCDLGIDPDSE